MCRYTNHWQDNVQIHQPLNSRLAFCLWNLPATFIFYQQLAGGPFHHCPVHLSMLGLGVLLTCQQPRPLWWFILSQQLLDRLVPWSPSCERFCCKFVKGHALLFLSMLNCPLPLPTVRKKTHNLFAQSHCSVNSEVLYTSLCRERERSRERDVRQDITFFNIVLVS